MPASRHPNRRNLSRGTGMTYRPASSRRARLALALASTLAVLGALLLTANPAAAKEFHTGFSSFGEAGTANGKLALAEHSGLAVNQETGDVYVADTGNARVQEFSSSGTFIRAFATANPTFIAIDNSTGASKGDVYVADSTTNAVSKFEADGTAVTGWGTSGQLSGNGTESFGTLDGIAVDTSGALYVLGEERHMFKFAPDGTPTERFEAAFGTDPVGIAVDSEGDIYKVRGSGATAKLNPSGEALVDQPAKSPCAPTGPARAEEEAVADYESVISLTHDTAERQYLEHRRDRAGRKDQHRPPGPASLGPGRVLGKGADAGDGAADDEGVLHGLGALEGVDRLQVHHAPVHHLVVQQDAVAPEHVACVGGYRAGLAGVVHLGQPGHGGSQPSGLGQAADPRARPAPRAPDWRELGDRRQAGGPVPYPGGALRRIDPKGAH